ncbi:TANK-binding kinase 1-binding protein 1 [Apteryx mantelli]|uniref:TANK-binding kinase 1-binding protein 1 n=1 Tax=Apteryx mantelli TaxID=2696672 RepID=A0ABM4FT59_9AVES
MDTMFEDDISILTQEALGQDEDWLDSPNTDLSGEMCSASHFALITAYDDIKNRLTGLERENSTLKRRLKTYELKYPLIGEFGEEHIFSVYEAKETSLLKSEKASLQQQLNQFQHELQKSKEREEQLDEMIQAYEKLCVEKSDLESELSEMRSLVEKHLSRIRSLEQQLRQRDGGSFGSLSAPLPGQEVPFLPLHGSPGLSHVLDCPVGWPSRSLEQLEAEREAARQEAQRAQHREEHLKAECERLQAELKHLQETRAQEQSERDMAWVKKVGDDQVNLALAYTELTEELCRLRSLSALQSQILRALLQEKSLNGGQRHSPLSQCHSPAQQRRSPAAPQCPSPAAPGRAPAPPCQSPALQRRSPAPAGNPSPAPQRRSPAPGPGQSPAQQRRSPAPAAATAAAAASQSPGQQRRSPAPLAGPAPAAASPHRLPGERGVPELVYAKPSSRHIKASFQGRRSYSEVSNVALYQQSRSLWLQPEASTLPKPRPYGELYLGGAGAPPSPRAPFEEHVRFEKQSSDEDDWAVPSPPSPEAGAIRCASFCAGFPIPAAAAAATAHRTAAAYARAEHAQSWPSINLLLETADSDIRSCPLCQLAFPVGYPDDALIKHIDSHLENSKI